METIHQDTWNCQITATIEMGGNLNVAECTILIFIKVNGFHSKNYGMTVIFGTISEKWQY